MLHYIKNIIQVRDYTVTCEFNTGETRTVNLKEIIEKYRAVNDGLISNSRIRIISKLSNSILTERFLGTMASTLIRITFIECQKKKLQPSDIFSSFLHFF